MLSQPLGGPAGYRSGLEGPRVLPDQPSGPDHRSPKAPRPILLAVRRGSA
jgi:hypothetical protein